MSHCFIFYWISNKNFSQIGKKGKTLCKKCDIFFSGYNCKHFYLCITICLVQMKWLICRPDAMFTLVSFDKLVCMNWINICFILTELTEISWYEWFIIAIRRLRSTIMLMIEKLPNITNPQNLVNSLIPANSKLSRSIKPNDAQNRVWVVSHRLKKIFQINEIDWTEHKSLLWKFSECKTMVDFNHYFIVFLISHLKWCIITLCICKHPKILYIDIYIFCVLFIINFSHKYRP